MITTLPIEILYLLEEKIGKEEAKKVSSAIIASLDVIETKANDTALQKKLELKDELTKELATKADIARLTEKLEEKATKADLQLVRSEILLVETRLEAKMKLYFVILLCAIFLSNPTAINLITKIIGIAK